MSPKGLNPSIEEIVAKLAERLRHLETDDKWHFGMIRNSNHFAVGSDTGGIQEAIDDCP